MSQLIECMRTNAYQIEMDEPSDVDELENLIESGDVKPDNIVGIIGKTEGNGLFDDFTRELAGNAFKELLGEKLGIDKEEVDIPIVMSGGTGCIVSPNAVIFTREDGVNTDSDSKKLAVGRSKTEKIEWDKVGKTEQVELVADAVKEAMIDANINSANDVHYVQTKGPLLTPERINSVEQEGKECSTTDPLTSMLYSNAASSLGIGVALDEVDIDNISDEVIGESWEYYTLSGSSSAGNEKKSVEVVLLGNSKEAESPYRIGSGVMKDMIDRTGFYDALNSIGYKFDQTPQPEQLDNVLTLFAQVAQPPDGKLRNKRITIKSESNIPSTRINRCVIGTTLASALGDPMIYVSGHIGKPQGAQGKPPESGPVAVIGEVE